MSNWTCSKCGKSGHAASEDLALRMGEHHFRRHPLSKGKIRISTPILYGRRDETGKIVLEPIDKP